MLTAERIGLIGKTVHTDASDDAIVVGGIVGWTEKGLPKVKLDRDPSVTSRVGGKSVVEAVPYQGELLPESGLPTGVRDDGAVMCWFCESEDGDLLASFPELGEVAERGIESEPESEDDLTDDELALMVEAGENEVAGSIEDEDGDTIEVTQNQIDDALELDENDEQVEEHETV